MHIFNNLPYYTWIIAWMKKGDNFQKAKNQPQCVDFANFISLVLLIKKLLIQKCMYFLYDNANLPYAVAITCIIQYNVTNIIFNQVIAYGKLTLS